jgi:hypothetical protein
VETNSSDQMKTSLVRRIQPDPIDVVMKKIVGEQDIVVTELTDGSGAIVIFSLEKHGARNAKIIDRNGKVRADVELPSRFQFGIGFSDAYYINGELTAIFVENGRDFAFVVDEKTGAVTRYYETR